MRELKETKATMTATQQMVARFKGADSEGNPVDPNSVQWISSDETVATVSPEPDGMSCHIFGGVPGDCKVVANGTAQSGKKPVIAVLALNVTPGEMAAGEITTEQPVEQGTAPDNSLPTRPPRPGHDLPNKPGVGVGGQLPTPPGARPDAGLPTQPGHPEAGLPNAPARPDQGLPPTAEPRRR